MKNIKTLAIGGAAVMVAAVLSVTILVFHSKKGPAVGTIYNKAGGVTVNKTGMFVFEQKPPRRVDEEFEELLVLKLPEKRSTAVTIQYVAHDGESESFARRIYSFLKNRGWRNITVKSIITSFPSTGEDIRVTRDGSVIIDIGIQV